MVTPVQNSALASGMTQALAQQGLISPASKIRFLRHPLLLWHPGGRRYTPQPAQGRLPWTTRFIGVSASHLQSLGLDPGQSALDDASDEMVHGLAAQLYTSRIYFHGGFAAYLRVPGPSTVEDGAYDVQALRRFTWSFVKKLGTLQPSAILNGIYQGMTLPFTRGDAKSVFPSKRLSSTQVDERWSSLLSTARVPTVHLVGSPSAGFLIDLGAEPDRLVERVDLLWSAVTSWRADGRTSTADITFPAAQVLLGAGTVRAILARTGMPDHEATVWDPRLWNEICAFLDALPEHAWSMAMHLLLSDTTDYPHLQPSLAMDYAYQVLGLAPPPYDKRQRHEVQRSLKRAVRDLFDAVNDHAPDALQPFFSAAAVSLQEWLIPTGTTRLLGDTLGDEEGLPATWKGEEAAPGGGIGAFGIGQEHLPTARPTPPPSPTDVPPQPDQHLPTARPFYPPSPTNTSP